MGGRPQVGTVAGDPEVELVTISHQADPGTRRSGRGGKTEGSAGRGRTERAGTGSGKERPVGARGQGPKLSGSAWPILRRLLRYMRPHIGVLAGVMVAALATTAIELAPPWIIRFSVDRYILGPEPERIWWAAGGLLALSVVQGAVEFGRLYLTAQTGQRIVFDLRNDVFEHLTHLSFSFYDHARTGDLMSRVTADTDVLSDFFGRAAVIVLTNLLTLLGILVVLLSWDWRLGLLYVFFLPLIVHGQWIYARRVRPAMGRVRRALSSLTSALQESLAGILVIKVFGRERFEQQKIDRESTAYREANIGTARITSLWMPYANVVMGVATALVIWIGGSGVIADLLTLGTLIGFVSYIQILLRPIRQTGMMLSVVIRSLAAAERVFEVLDTDPDVEDAPDAYPLPSVKGRIRYEGVTFAYDEGPEGVEALRDVSLEASPGEMVALVGPSGAGKTTLVHLLPRFYDAQEGRITIDGHDISGVTVDSLRDAIGIALQSVFLFDASIGENIAYGNPGVTQGQIEWAADVVQMHEFIRSLPLGYGTPVGERGVRLSGGQKQRIALARVLLTDPRILILDEPTSSVDAETERRMQEALTEVRAGRTTLVIAHRLWTVQQADQILVLRDGRIVERARGIGAGAEGRSAHQVLLAADGFYRELYELQFQAEALGATEPIGSGTRRHPQSNAEGGQA